MAPAQQLELMPELVEEILLRVRPDEPASLVRATLACKLWRRIASHRDFLRRYHEFHQSPPLLGYIHKDHRLYLTPTPAAGFIPTSTATPVSMAPLCGGWSSPLDCRHGRVLVLANVPVMRLVVWDPLTGDEQHLSVPAYYPHSMCSRYTGAVLCATNGCDHLNCHSGPFLVVFVGTTNTGGDLLTWASTYSSKTGVWSASTSIGSDYYIGNITSLLIGNMLYFTFEEHRMLSILKYDLCSHGLSIINTPEAFSFSAILMKPPDEGGIRLVFLFDNCIYMWSLQDGADRDGWWVKLMLIDLGTLLPKGYRSCYNKVIGFAEGTNTIFISIWNNGVFTLDLKSRQVRK